MKANRLSRVVVVTFHIFSVSGLLLMLLWPGFLSLDVLFRALQCFEEVENACQDGYVHGWQSEDNFVRLALVQGR